MCSKKRTESRVISLLGRGFKEGTVAARQDASVETALGNLTDAWLHAGFLQMPPLDHWSFNTSPDFTSTLV